jgi:hypothetical protein
VLVGAGVVLVSALIVFLFLPARASDVREHEEGAIDGLASATFAGAEGQLELTTLEQGKVGRRGGPVGPGGSPAPAGEAERAGRA